MYLISLEGRGDDDNVLLLGKCAQDEVTHR